MMIHTTGGEGTGSGQGVVKEGYDEVATSFVGPMSLPRFALSWNHRRFAASSLSSDIL